MNLVTSKVVFTTPNELWTWRKPRTSSVLGSPAHVLKRDPSNQKQGHMIAYLWDIPKKTKCYLFYDPQEQGVIVYTNARVLEKDHQMNNKPRFKNYSR